VVTIAHRLSTAEGAQRVFVFDAGRLVQEGTHGELVIAGGRYAALYRSWLGNVRDDGAAAEGAPAPTRS
jgi:putative ABC transport system ATP-binding protein